MPAAQETTAPPVKPASKPLTWGEQHAGEKKGIQPDGTPSWVVVGPPDAATRVPKRLGDAAIVQCCGCDREFLMDVATIQALPTKGPDAACGCKQLGLDDGQRRREKSKADAAERDKKRMEYQREEMNRRAGMYA
jgi:hypothetical protein